MESFEERWSQAAQESLHEGVHDDARSSNTTNTRKTFLGAAIGRVSNQVISMVDVDGIIRQIDIDDVVSRVDW